MLFGVINNGTENIVVSGTANTGDVITITTIDSSLSGGQESINYTVQAGDTLSSIAEGIATAINADSNLQGIKVSATNTGAIVNVRSGSGNETTYKTGLSSGATELITLGLNIDVMQYGYDDVNALTTIAQLALFLELLS